MLYTFKVLLQDWVGSNPNRHLADEPIDVADHFNYLDSLINPSGLAKKRSHSVMLMPKRLLPTSGIYNAAMTSAYQPTVEYTMQQCSQSYFVDLRRSHCVSKIAGAFQCLTTGVSEALLQYVGNTVSAPLKRAGWC